MKTALSVTPHHDFAGNGLSGRRRRKYVLSIQDMMENKQPSSRLAYTQDIFQLNAGRDDE
jgi:hypothetical protein